MNLKIDSLHKITSLGDMLEIELIQVAKYAFSVNGVTSIEKNRDGLIWISHKGVVLGFSREVFDHMLAKGLKVEII